MTNYSVFRERFQDLNHAGDYDRSRFGGLLRSINNRVWLRAVRRCLEEARPVGPVLDLPVGTGRLVPLFREMGVRTIGVDLSIPMLQHARAKGAAWVLRADAERLPLRDGAVDGIVCLRFLHHPRGEARARIFSEMARVARRFVILDYRYRNSTREALRLVERLCRGKREPKFRPSIADIRVEVERAGWRVARILYLPRLASDNCLVLATV